MQNPEGSLDKGALIVGFVALYAGCSALYYQSPVDLLSAAAAITYAFSVVQTKAAYSRLWYVFNPLLWLIYDLFAQAYVNILLHSAVFAPPPLPFGTMTWGEKTANH